MTEGLPPAAALTMVLGCRKCHGSGPTGAVTSQGDAPDGAGMNISAVLGLSSREDAMKTATKKMLISIRPDRSEGRLVGYGLWATKPGVGDRVERYLERTPQAKFHLSTAYPPSMRLGRLHRCGVTRKVAVAAFETFAVEALKTVDVSRTETKNWSVDDRARCFSLTSEPRNRHRERAAFHALTVSTSRRESLARWRIPLATPRPRSTCL
jgi:hypothetical protein